MAADPLATVPPAPGTYIVVLRAAECRAVPLRRRGVPVTVPRGWYLYVGSAHGPGGCGRG